MYVTTFYEYILTNSIHKNVFEFLFVAYIKLLNIIEYNDT